MPFEFSGPHGGVLGYAELVFDSMVVAESNGLRGEGEPFDSQLRANEIVRVRLESEALEPKGPLMRQRGPLVVAQEYKTPGLHQRVFITSGPFTLVPGATSDSRP